MRNVIKMLGGFARPSVYGTNGFRDAAEKWKMPLWTALGKANAECPVVRSYHIRSSHSFANGDERDRLDSCRPSSRIVTSPAAMRRIALIALVCLPTHAVGAQTSLQRLQRLLSEASVGNQLPPALLSYAADVESSGDGATGIPRISLSPQYVSDVVRFNRVEGLFTGASVKLSMRDRSPGTVIRATAGWAWTEQAVRGRVSAVRTRAPAALGVHVERALDVTDDFQRNTDPQLPSLAFANAPSFVDRRSTGLFAEFPSDTRKVHIRGEVGVYDDRDAPTRVSTAPYGNTVYRKNHGVDEGGYLRSALIVEWHPTAAEPGAKSGRNVRLYYQRGDGTLAFQRWELRVVNNSYAGPFRFTATGNAGLVNGARIPSQRLFELTRSRALPGHDSSYAGSRAVATSFNARYTSRFLTRPYEIPGLFTIPGVAPGLTAGIYGGWTDNHSAAANAALLRLGVLTDSANVPHPVARVTDGVRGGARVGVHFFSGLLFVGFERALEKHALWRFTLNGRN